MSRGIRQGRIVLWGIVLSVVLYLVVTTVFPDDVYRLLGRPVAALVAYWLFVHYFERRRCSELGGGLLGVLWFDLGAQAGMVLASVPVIIWWLAGLYLPGSIPSWDLFSLTLVAFLGLGTTAVLEEVVCRGLLLRLLELKLGSWAALVISSLLFAVYHLPAGHETLADVADLALVGVSLGTAFLLTRRLWMPIALHGFFSLTLAAFSGSTGVMPLFNGHIVGSGYWTYQAGKWIIIYSADVVLAVTLIVIAWRRGAFVSSDVARQRELSARGMTPSQAETAVAAVE